jgi:hypothetical protein
MKKQIKTKPVAKSGLKVRTNVRAGRLSTNHNQTLIRG